MWLHCETDEELRQRCLDALKRSGSLALIFCGLEGAHLERVAEEELHIRRRIVLRTA